MEDIRQEAAKNALNTMAQNNPMLTILMVLVLGGSVGAGGMNAFGGSNEQLAKIDGRVGEVEKTLVAHGAALKTMEGQQVKIDKTLESLTAAINELNRTTAVMNSTIENMKRG